MSNVSEVVQNVIATGNNREKFAEKKYKWDIVWANVILIAGLHLLALYGWTLKYNVLWTSTIFLKTLGIMSGLGITGGAHRLWTHKTYKANKIAQIILMFMASLTYQNSVYIWARDHRMHHKYSETDADPHNATRGFFFSHVGWLFLRKHPEVIEKGRTLDMSDLKANPIVMFQHKYYYPIVIMLVLVLPTFIPWYFWGETFKNALLVCTIHRFVMQLNFTWGVNSFAHLYGNKPYDTTIGPVENSLMKVVSLGEGFHNYHHSFPWDYKAAEMGTDFRNMTTYLIDGFAKLGWAWDRKTASNMMIHKKRSRTGDTNIQTETRYNIVNLLLVALFIIFI